MKHWETEFCPDVVGEIPLDDRPRLLWRAFYRVYRSLRRKCPFADTRIILAADQIFVHQPFSIWWDRLSTQGDDPLDCPIFIREIHWESTGRLLIARGKV